METHISGQRGEAVWKKMGFDGHFIKEARGQSGGIWCLWDSSKWKVDILAHNSQMVHMKVKSGSSPYYFLTAIYGSPQRINRNYLWDDIRSIHNEINLPWCLIGDFNALLHDHERHDGSNSNSRGACPDFQACVSDCGLLDLGYSGWPFTWKRGNLVESLDRGLSNLDW
ncbi:uncharacterized protein LOC107613288 [Arachis ipaensis]|nr:uncharacterized protein LOC107613288 [Arachis ipaensis]